MMQIKSRLKVIDRKESNRGMKLRLLIKGDAIQCGENDFYCPCRTIDVVVADDLLDKEHEHIIGVEVEPQEGG